MKKNIVNSGFSDWKPDQLPSLAGKTYFITGGNSGIGLEAAKMLAAAGGDVIIGCRNTDKGVAALAEISMVAKGKCDQVRLDLTSLASVRQAADELRNKTDRLDALVNNAGIMQTPQQQTADGFEMQFGTNHLGHFLLGGLLFDLVNAAKGRVVVVSSIAHKYGKINFNDLMLTKGYDPTKAYTQSKLANLMFALELDRKLKAVSSSVSCMACHPGYSNTALQDTGPSGFLNALYKLTNPLMAQPSYNGAIPTVLCAAGTEAVPGAYYGPTGFMEARGPVSDASVAGRARKERVAARLWQESEKLVGFNWRIV
ncbi:oxidoreductase [Hyphococcus sp.]|uniref:oxidoreductase n=1 Tax=Hyphococcus sp. TaxID=2038636 RepID=UPI002085426D|nr:MAG: putative short-chain dehydrogenase/reductase [Marinicaulis sp.]